MSPILSPIRRAVAPVLAAFLIVPLIAPEAGRAEGVPEAGPGAEAGIEVVEPWARPTIPNRPGAVYLELRNRAEAADRLVGVRAEGVGAAELHRAEEKDGVMTMAPVDGIEVPAGGAVSLAPGGFHIMLFDIAEPLKEGDTVRLVLELERAGEVAVAAPVVRRMGHGAGHGMDQGTGHGTGHGAAGN